MEGLQTVKIATWNINSVRHRINLVTRFLRDQQPDILCLQETKVVDELFPKAPLAKLGYVHQAIHGQKAYHGVAIPLAAAVPEDRATGFLPRRPCQRIWRSSSDRRNGLELHNFYVPAGGDIPDPKKNEKFAHKLHFLGEVEKFFAARKSFAQRARDAGVGDLNVAPLENDGSGSHKQLLDRGEPYAGGKRGFWTKPWRRS